MRRLLWTFGMGLAGLWFGWYGQGYPLDFGLLATFATWDACIGLGFGSIFDQRCPSTRVIIYWVITAALMGSALFPLMPLRFVAVQVAVAAGGGAFFGLFVGSLHFRLARRRLRVSKVNDAAHP